MYRVPESQCDWVEYRLVLSLYTYIVCVMTAEPVKMEYRIACQVSASADFVNQTSKVTRRIPWWRNRKQA